MTLNELKSWLESQGFKSARYFTREERNTCDWYAQRGQITVKPYSTSHGFEFASVEIHGQTNGFMWKLVVPQLIPEELTQRLAEIEELLMRCNDILRKNP